MYLNCIHILNKYKYLFLKYIFIIYYIIVIIVNIYNLYGIFRYILNRNCRYLESSSDYMF